MKTFQLRLCATLCAMGFSYAPAADFRPPAVPLVTHDPYFSIWSMSDHLTDSQTKHWTGVTHSLSSLIRVDGKTYRIMGREPRRVPALEQTKLEVLPTHTIYSFEGAGVRATLTFLTPALPDDLDVLSRPATYLTWNVRSADGGKHEVDVYFDAGSEIVVNRNDEPVTWSRFRINNLQVLRMGSQYQPMLQKAGDDLRIDWGYLYLTAPADDASSQFAGSRQAAFDAFLDKGSLPDSDDMRPVQPYAQPTPALAYVFRLGAVSATPVSRHAVLAYDDLYSIEYFHRQLRRTGAATAPKRPTC